MEKITYVTGNRGKYLSVKEKFQKAGIDIDFFKMDTRELPVNDIKKISQEKARQAYMALRKPCFVADSGFYIEAYPNNPGYPGAYVKRSGVANDVESLLKDMNGIDNRNCYFLDCLTYYDGREFRQFFGRSEGTLSTTVRGSDLYQAKSELWKVFIPKNCTKTLAEMSDHERLSRQDDHTSSTEEFITWLKNHNMDYQFDNLCSRVSYSMNNSDLDFINQELSMINEPTIVTGVGGSSVVSTFASKVLSVKNGVIAVHMEPRDMLYTNYKLYKNVLVCSYGGKNLGVDVSFNNNLKKYLLSHNESNLDNVVNLTYDIDEEERSFISLSSTLIPINILLSYYLGRKVTGIPSYNYDIDTSCDIYEIFTGLDTSTTSKYLESTLTESGIGIPILHDKYDYCHGRSTLSKGRNSVAIYLSNKTELDRLLLHEIQPYYKDVIVLNSHTGDMLLDDYNMLIKAMYLTRYIARSKGKDLSGVDYQPIVKKLYKYNGNM
jgi:XTP/dITP diphosphohydrolase